MKVRVDLLRDRTAGVTEDLRQLEDVASGARKSPANVCLRSCKLSCFGTPERIIATLNGRNTFILLRGSCASNLSRFTPGQSSVFELLRRDRLLHRPMCIQAPARQLV